MEIYVTISKPTLQPATAGSSSVAVPVERIPAAVPQVVAPVAAPMRDPQQELERELSKTRLDVRKIVDLMRECDALPPKNDQMIMGSRLLAGLGSLKADSDIPAVLSAISSTASPDGYTARALYNRFDRLVKAAKQGVAINVDAMVKELVATGKISETGARKAINLVLMEVAARPDGPAADVIRSALTGAATSTGDAKLQRIAIWIDGASQILDVIRSNANASASSARPDGTAGSVLLSMGTALGDSTLRGAGRLAEVGKRVSAGQATFKEAILGLAEFAGADVQRIATGVLSVSEELSKGRKANLQRVALELGLVFGLSPENTQAVYYTIASISAASAGKPLQLADLIGALSGRLEGKSQAALLTASQVILTAQGMVTSVAQAKSTEQLSVALAALGGPQTAALAQVGFDIARDLGAGKFDVKSSASRIAVALGADPAKVNAIAAAISSLETQRDGKEPFVFTQEVLEAATRTLGPQASNTLSEVNRYLAAGRGLAAQLTGGQGSLEGVVASLSPLMGQQGAQIAQTALLLKQDIESGKFTLEGVAARIAPLFNLSSADATALVRSKGDLMGRASGSLSGQTNGSATSGGDAWTTVLSLMEGANAIAGGDAKASISAGLGLARTLVTEHRSNGGDLLKTARGSLESVGRLFDPTGDSRLARNLGAAFDSIQAFEQRDVASAFESALTSFGRANAGTSSEKYFTAARDLTRQFTSGRGDLDGVLGAIIPIMGSDAARIGTAMLGLKKQLDTGTATWQSAAGYVAQALNISPLAAERMVRSASDLFEGGSSINKWNAVLDLFESGSVLAGDAGGSVAASIRTARTVVNNYQATDGDLVQTARSSLNAIGDLLDRGGQGGLVTRLSAALDVVDRFNSGDAGKDIAGTTYLFARVLGSADLAKVAAAAQRGQQALEMISAGNTLGGAGAGLNALAALTGSRELAGASQVAVGFAQMGSGVTNGFGMGLSSVATGLGLLIGGDVGRVVSEVGKWIGVAMNPVLGVIGLAVEAIIGCLFPPPERNGHMGDDNKFFAANNGSSGPNSLVAFNRAGRNQVSSTLIEGATVTISEQLRRASAGKGANRGSQLQQGELLLAGQYLVSKDGSSRTVMSEQGELLVQRKKAGTNEWETRLSGYAPAVAGSILRVSAKGTLEILRPTDIPSKYQIVWTGGESDLERQAAGKGLYANGTPYLGGYLLEMGNGGPSVKRQSGGEVLTTFDINAEGRARRIGTAAIGAWSQVLGASGKYDSPDQNDELKLADKNGDGLIDMKTTGSIYNTVAMQLDSGKQGRFVTGVTENNFFMNTAADLEKLAIATAIDFTKWQDITEHVGGKHTAINIEGQNYRVAQSKENPALAVRFLA
jgi:hypothetical protein